MNNMFVFGATLHRRLPGARLRAGHPASTRRSWRELLPHHLPLPPCACRSSSPGEVWQWFLNPEFGLQKSVRDRGWSRLHVRLAGQPRRMAIYTHGDRRDLARRRPRHGADAGRHRAASRTRSGRRRASKASPAWRIYLSNRAADGHCRRCFTSVALLGAGADQELRPRGRHDRRRPRHRHRRAVEVRDGTTSGALQHRLGHRGRHVHAADDSLHRRPLPAVAGAAAAPPRDGGPDAPGGCRPGPRPARPIVNPAGWPSTSSSAIATVFFLAPIYVMVRDLAQADGRRSAAATRWRLRSRPSLRPG